MALNTVKIHLVEWEDEGSTKGERKLHREINQDDDNTHLPVNDDESEETSMEEEVDDNVGRRGILHTCTCIYNL